MLLLSGKRFFKMAGKSSIVESISSKVTGEIFILVPQSSASKNVEKFPFNPLKLTSNQVFQRYLEDFGKFLVICRLSSSA